MNHQHTGEKRVEELALKPLVQHQLQLQGEQREIAKMQ
jgi:hypothetical protein